MAQYTTEQYQQLCAMLAKGVTSLEVAGEKIQFRSLDEMMRIKNMMERNLGLAATPGARYPSYRRG